MTANKRRWLLTGANGFIGRHLLLYLQKNDEDVICVIEPSSTPDCAQFAIKGKIFEIDLRVTRLVEELIADVQPTHVINLAAVGVSPTASESICDFVDLNVRLPGLLHALIRPCSVLVQAGSMSQYRGSDEPIGENDGVRSEETLYAWSKNSADSLLEIMDRQAQAFRSVRARLFGVIGPGEPGHRLIPTIVRKIREGGVVGLSDGAQVRDVLHVEDVARALFHVATTQTYRGRAVNIGRGEGRSVRWIAERVGRRLGGLASLDFGAVTRRVGEPEVLVAEVGLLKSSGWKPLFSYEESIDLTVDALLAGESQT